MDRIIANIRDLHRASIHLARPRRRRDTESLAHPCYAIRMPNASFFADNCLRETKATVECGIQEAKFFELKQARILRQKQRMNCCGIALGVDRCVAIRGPKFLCKLDCFSKVAPQREIDHFVRSDGRRIREAGTCRRQTHSAEERERPEMERDLVGTLRGWMR